MRRTVRPFVKEFKTRWSKSSKSQAQADVECDTPRFTQPFLNFDAAAQDGNHDDAYHAALKAADAAFGALSPIVLEGAMAPSHVGRVLPSLVEEVPPPLVRSPEAKEKSQPARKGRKTGSVRNAKNPVSVAARKRAASVKVAAAKALPEKLLPAKTLPAKTLPAKTLPTKTLPSKVQNVKTPVADQGLQPDASETRLDPAARREGRSIQKRWVLKAELKAGEKWKRRLRNPAW